MERRDKCRNLPLNIYELHAGSWKHKPNATCEDGSDGWYNYEELAKELFANGQVAFQYADAAGNPTAEAPWNPNGSSYAIEGIISQNGLILGKMGHTERYENNLFKNIAGNKQQSLFANAVAYFRKVQ